MFHSFGCDTYAWSRSFLSIRLAFFERFCRYLRDQSYKTLFLNEWYDIENSSISSKDKLVLLTFDDGYLDNYVYVYPILKKYGLKGTIFVNPEFVDVTNVTPRKKFDEYGFDKNNIKNVLGFLNWEEIVEMDSSGVIDIQNHTMSHNRYFSGPSLIDFLTPENADKYDWMLWWQKSEIKPYYMHINLFDYLSQGLPVFENNRALSIRRFFPDSELIAFLSERFRFEYKKHDYKSAMVIMKSEYEKLLQQGKYPGRFESDEEMLQRFKYELDESRKIFMEKLNKRTDFLCWPGGGWNDLSLQLADELGYKASTVRINENENLNNYKIRHKAISRKGLSDLYFINEKYIRSSSPNILIDKFLAQNGNQFKKRKLQIYKLFKFALAQVNK